MDLHTRAIEGFKRSDFHTKYVHRKPGMYDSNGHGSRERQGRPFVLPEDRAPPIRTESVASSTSFDSAHSDRYTTRMGNGSEQHRLQQSDPFVSTGTDLIWGSSSSMDMSPRTRQRQDSSNSNGHVKFAPDNAAFENLRSEAMELWHNGVDLELKQSRHQPPKKKSEWMSESEFQNYQGSSTDHKTTSTTAAAAPTSSSTNGRTFAQVANPTNNNNVNSIGWSPEEEQSIPTNTMLQHQHHLPQQQQQPSPFNHHHQQQQQHPSSLHYIMSPPRIQRQGAETETVVSPIQVTPPPPPAMPLAIDHIGDAKMYRRLFFMSTSLYKPESTRRPYEDIEELLLKCRQLGEKNFGMMVHMLLSRFKQERSQTTMHSKLPIATIMRKSWINFYAAVNDYIHFSVLTPHELLPLLELFSQFASAFPGYEGIPLSTLRKRYQEIKGVFEHQHMQRSETLLREIERDMEAKPDLRMGDYDHWQSNRESGGEWKKSPDHSKLPIPPIPDAELLLQETRVMLEIENKRKIPATSPLRQYLRDHRLDRITNILHTPYPNEETYLTVHYVLLRDEIFGPLYDAIRQYAIEGSTKEPITKFGYGWTMHTHFKSVCSAFLPTINEPAIVFEIGFPCPQSSLPLEGSMAVLIPSGSGLLSWDSLLDTTVKGTVACTYVTPRGVSMLAIHIDREQVERVNWSATYTVLTSNTNSMAMLPVLEWLQSQCTQINDRNLSKVVTPLLLSPSGATGSTTSSLTNETPDYLCGVMLNISNILVPKLKAKGFKAQIGANEGTSTWPEHSKTQLALHPSQREPLYSLSSSQLKAIQYALTHQVAMITGTEGTGKTFLATKLIELTYQALVSSQCFQPILVLTRRESTLDDILERLVNTIPDLLRLGAAPAHEPLLIRQAIRVAEPNIGDPDRKYNQMLERKIATWQGHLTALWKYRKRIEQGDPSVMVTTLPPYCKQAMVRSCMSAIVKPFTDFTMEQLWDFWMDENDKDASIGKYQRHASDPVDRGLTQAVFATCGKRAQPIMERKWFNERRQWIEKHTPEIASLADAPNWPLPTSSSSYEIRKKMVRIWNTVEPQELWNLPRDRKHKLRSNVIDALLDIIDANIDMILQEQMKAAKILEDARQKKWVSSCRFSRVVGMTAECAAQNTELVSSLWPRVVIVDEAHEILESTVLPFVLGSRAEHVIMIGDHQSTMPPPVHNPALRDEPKHLDTSMFERWKRSGGTMIRLEEQWRMCKEIAGIHDSVAMTATTAPDRSLLITAPIASENCVDESSIELFGVSQRAFFINHAINPQGESTTHGFFSRMCGAGVTEQDVDEARYACHLGLYLFQQGYKPSQITILTLSPIMNKLIKTVMHEHIRTVSVFSKPAVDGIHVHGVDDYIGKENMFVILVLRMPDEQVIPEDNISLALSRARHGLYIVGNVSYLGKGIWANVAQQMRARGSLDSHLTVTCKSHPESTNHLGHYRDFESVRNGGCNRVCNTLLECGHACEEMCHHLKHSSATSKCKRPCVRPRSCEHNCPNACYECENQPCPPCTEMTTKTLPCGHTATGQCSEISDDKFECQNMVERELPCGHTYTAKCHLTPNEGEIKCEEVVDMVLDCGHQVSAPCGYKPICTQVCRERLECGHPCSKPCGSEQHSHSRDLCTASCPKQLICGHNCAKGCASAEEHTDRCLEPCRHVCSHGYKCGRDCWEVCNLCMNPCPYMCEHKRCTKKCYERCDRLPCEEACSKILDCSHPCPGLCGEPCPPCKECNPDLKCSISLRTLSEFEKNEKVYMLPECGCVFAAESLDLYFNNQAKNGEHTAIKLWQCPSCQKPIYTALRYNIYIKTEIALVNQIKRQQEEIRQRISQREKQDIIEAMNAETKMSVHNIVGGRWFVCENGHPYYIGECGGATEISNCPHCGAVIGGLQHKVVDSNRFYGEFDGSFQPAWPGQPS